MENYKCFYNETQVACFWIMLEEEISFHKTMKMANSDVDFHNFQMDTITVTLVEDKCFIWKIKRNKFPHQSVLRIKAVQGCPL